MPALLTAFRLLAALTLLTGGLYPLAVWAVATSLFPGPSAGSLIRNGGTISASRLVAQPARGPGWFRPRPSAAGYATVASGASNLAWTDARLASAIAERRQTWSTLGLDDPHPALLTTSGSGLDPDLPLDAALQQVPIVARERSMDATAAATLARTVTALARSDFCGGLIVNVHDLNSALPPITE